jgi:hypothetical protein
MAVMGSHYWLYVRQFCSMLSLGEYFSLFFLTVRDYLHLVAERSTCVKEMGMGFIRRCTILQFSFVISKRASRYL